MESAEAEVVVRRKRKRSLCSFEGAESASERGTQAKRAKSGTRKREAERERSESEKKSEANLKGGAKASERNERAKRERTPEFPVTIA